MLGQTRFLPESRKVLTDRTRWRNSELPTFMLGESRFVLISVRRINIASMKLGEITKPMIRLLDDSLAAESYLDANDSQFARRAYIRSIFASLEGIVWLLKQVCLKAPNVSGPRRFDPAEFALLQDQTYDLKNNGEPSTQTKFLRLPDNVRFTFRVFNRLFQANVDLGVGGNSWTAFLRALDVRHRITHPKKVDELDISDTEIKLCREVSSWFNETVHAAVQAIVDTSARVTNAPNKPLPRP